MLSNANRLKKEKDIERVFKTGKGIKEGFLVFKMAKSQFKNSRFCFIVGKNVSRKANIRNKIKRRMREIVRAKMKKIKKEIDGIFIAKPGIETKDFWEIEEMVDKVLKTAKILN